MKSRPRLRPAGRKRIVPGEPPAGAVVREVRIASAAVDVFPFFTDPTKMVLWKARAAWIDAAPGREFRIDVNGRSIARGQFIEIDPPRRIVFTWGWEGDNGLPPGASRVEVTLSEVDGETVVRLVHTGIPEQLRETNADGWDHYLPRLRVAAEGRSPGPDSWAAPPGR